MRFEGSFSVRLEGRKPLFTEDILTFVEGTVKVMPKSPKCVQLAREAVDES